MAETKAAADPENNISAKSRKTDGNCPACHACNVKPYTVFESGRNSVTGVRCPCCKYDSENRIKGVDNGDTGDGLHDDGPARTKSGQLKVATDTYKDDPPPPAQAAQEGSGDPVETTPPTEKPTEKPVKSKPGKQG